MKPTPRIKIRSLLEFYEVLPESERLIVDVLRLIIKDNLPQGCREKFSHGVPFFYGKKGICIVWPSTIPGGGIAEGVLLGFWQGNRLNDPEHYLSHGSNKKVYYRIFKSVDEIDERPLVRLLKEAVMIDALPGHGRKKA